MSKRVTTQTEIKDKSIATAALKAMGATYSEAGQHLHITSGQFKNASINLTTGEVTSDTDWGHDKSKLGLLRQHYAEAKVRAESARQGATVTGREVLKNGDIVLMCQMGG